MSDPIEAPAAGATVSPHAEAMTLMCPILTLAQAFITAARAPSAGPDAIPCQGPACGLYLPSTDAKGHHVGGGCSLRATPHFLSQQNVGLVQVLEILARRAKLSPIG